MYSGKKMDDAPDINIILKKGYTASTFGEELITPGFGQGYHGNEGIFLCSGKEITCNKKINSELTDLAPTILNILMFPSLRIWMVL